jgi:hypothetical protein
MQSSLLPLLHPLIEPSFSPHLFTLHRLVPYRLSPTRKSRVRLRLKAVDDVISTVQASGVHCKALDRALELPKESEMDARDKYTTYSPKGRDFRKGVHKVSCS